MTRDDGFPVMDVSTDYLNDPKWRRLHRAHPELLVASFMAYTATMAESWKSGRRVTIEEAWPALLPFDAAVIEALQDAGFLDRKGLVVVKSWDGWFRPAEARRARSRERWRKYNEKRDADTLAVPRGNDADTATSVPPVRPSVPPGPTVPSKRTDFYPVDEQPKSGAYPAIGAVRPGR